MNKFFLQRRISLQRRAGASGGQFSIINFSFKEACLPVGRDPPSEDNQFSILEFSNI